MGLANIMRVLRRHLLVSTLVLGVTLAAAAAFYVLTPTQYETTSSFVLFPGAVPTDQLFANHPEYAKRNSDNPYLNGGDVSTATAVLIQTMESDDVRRQLVAQGADRAYVVAIDNSVLSGGQMISVTGTGTSAEMAEHTAQVVGAALPKKLTAMQTINGAETPFLITARQTLSPDQAVAKTSGKLRSVVVIVIGGFAMLFGALTVLEAMAAARAERGTSTASRRRRGRAHVAGPATGSTTTATAPVPVVMPAAAPAPVVAVQTPVRPVVPPPVARPEPVAPVAAPAPAPVPDPVQPAGEPVLRRVAAPRASVRARAAGHPVTPLGRRRTLT